MKIALHRSTRNGYFSERWIAYCQEMLIPYKIVNCYDFDIIRQLADCDALLWHFSHADARDFLFAKQLIKSVEEMGLIVMPNYNSCWHFDDKVAQKYLFEAIGANTPDTWIFYDKYSASKWAYKAKFPVVFKLRGGASSGNVVLVKKRKEAYRLIKKAFGRGFRQFRRITEIKDTLYRYIQRKVSFVTFLKAFAKFFMLSKYESIKGNEKGYIYFQEFLPGNNYDLRVIVIGDQAFAIKRLVRDNDFRASGSGKIIYTKEEIDQECVLMAFDYSYRIGSNCLAYDFVYNESKKPMIVEISFGFSAKAYYSCEGYWDKEINWHKGNFFPQDWMVELIVKQVLERKENVAKFKSGGISILH
jgi:glutathione synthase/RimK-type ligase-like ATP-grasp enzyme